MEKHEKIAQEGLERAKKERRASMPEDERKKAEARDAAAASSAENQKTKDEQAKKAREKAEAQAKEDERILSAEPDKLSEKDKKRRKELDSVKSKKDKEQKDKDAQDKINKRFGELTGKIKDLERDKDAHKQELETLRNEKAELEKTLHMSPEDKERETLKKAEKERIEKYLLDDKDKSREERREMSKEELDEWYAEDPAAAQAWVTERTLRRVSEREHYAREAKMKKDADALLKKQDDSFKKVVEKHPELDVTKRRAELKQKGKKDTEIQEILCKENPKHKTCSEVIRDNPEFLYQPNAPELIAAEMEKRLEGSEPANKGKTYTAEDIEQIKKKAVEEEEERRRAADEAAGITSSRGTEREDKDLSELEKEEERIRKKMGLTKEQLEASKKRRSRIPGAQYGR